MRKFVAEIVASLENEPERWRPNYCTFRRDDGLAIWDANVPWLDCNIYSPVEIGLSLSEKWKVWRAVVKCKESLTLAHVLGRNER